MMDYDTIMALLAVAVFVAVRLLQQVVRERREAEAERMKTQRKVGKII